MLSKLSALHVLGLEKCPELALAQLAPEQSRLYWALLGAKPQEAGFSVLGPLPGWAGRRAGSFNGP